jgi:uncharacterized protein (TIGR00269 family)
LPLCDSCREREAVVYQPHTGRRLCKQCFLKDILGRVEDEIRRYGMIKPGEKVLLALSGGKDSFVLLDTLSQIHDPSRLIGLSIVEGVEGYNRAEDIEKLRRYASERGVDIIITSFKEFVGYSLDEIVARAWSRGLKVSPCTFCGALRRRIINTYARQLGADKTATAHTLDDEAQTAIMNILRGDPDRLVRQHPLAPSLSEKFVQRVKPLRRIYEWETTMYAYLKGFRFQETECRYIYLRPTLRARLRERLMAVERIMPGSLLNILDTVDRIVEANLEAYRNLPPLPLCERCGEPTSHGRRLCKTCELLEKIGIT